MSPPEIIDLSGITWQIGGVNQQHFRMRATITTTSITSLISKLQGGQIFVMQFVEKFTDNEGVICVPICKVKSALTAICGSGTMPDGRRLFIAGTLLTSVSATTLSIQIDCFGTSIS